MNKLTILLSVFWLASCAGPNQEQTEIIEGSSSEVDVSEPGISDDPDVEPGQEPSTDLEILPGQSIGAIRLGMTYAEMREAFGEIPQAFGFRRLYIVPYPEFGVDVVYASAREDGLSDDAWVMAVGTQALEGFAGAVLPGMTRAEVEADYGVAPEEARGHAFYESGVSIKYEDDVVARVGIFKPYTIRLTPPPMAHAEVLEVQQ